MSAQNVTQIAASLLVMQSKIKAALYGMYIGDALAMPVHWYYDTSRIRKDFGPGGIQKYEAPVKHFPGSIMNLSNTGGGGRGSDKDSIVGEIILHGKKNFWLRGGSYHYHHGMKAGENTLDTLIARLMLQTLLSMENKSSTGDDDQPFTRNITSKYYDINENDSKTSVTTRVDMNSFTETFLDAYIKYMTTPDSHNDVYAATAHRMFFANYANKREKFHCADNDGHNTDSVDGIINVLIVSLNEMVVRASQLEEIKEAKDAVDLKVDVTSKKTKRGDTSLNKVIFDSINVIRKSEELPLYGYIYHNLLVKLIWEEKDLRKAIVEIIDEYPSVFKQGMRGLSKERLEEFRRTDASADPMSACYVSSNFPVMLMLAYKYADSLEKALLASANAGGENVNRNALLGGIMGASKGMSEEVKRLLEGLVEKDALVEEVEEFAAFSTPESSNTKNEL